MSINSFSLLRWGIDIIILRLRFGVVNWRPGDCLRVTVDLRFRIAAHGAGLFAKKGAGVALWVFRLPIPQVTAHRLEVCWCLETELLLRKRRIGDEVWYVTFPKLKFPVINISVTTSNRSSYLRPMIVYLKSNPVALRIAWRMSKTLIPLPFPRLYALK